MYSIQDIIAKTSVQRREISEALDQANGEKGWHPEDANLYKGLSQNDQAQIKETLDSLSLAEILVLGTTTTGADKLVAQKLYDTLVYAVKPYDLCPQISAFMAEKWPGGNLTVTVAKDGTYKARPFVGGAKMMEVNPSFVQGTLKPLGYGVPILAGKDLVEDNQFEVIQWHVEQAAKAVGKQATDLALTTLKTATDGDGTKIAVSGDTNETKLIGGTPGTNDIESCVRQLGANEWIANTWVTTEEALVHSAGNTAGTALWHPLEPKAGYQFKIGFLDGLISNSPTLHYATDVAGAAFTKCVTAIFDRNNALLTGRKRWMEIKNYNHPIDDIAGAVVSFRQNSVSLYNDSIAILTEA